MSKLEQYGHNFQIKTLSSLLKDKEFLQQVADIVSPDFFDNEANKWIISKTLEYFNEFRTAQNGFSAAGQTLQGAKESCEDHKLGCKNVKVKRTEYDKAEAALNKAKAKENELKQIILK